MRGDRFRQCPPRRWDLCPIPKISDIFHGVERSVRYGDDWLRDGDEFESPFVPSPSPSSVTAGHVLNPG